MSRGKTASAVIHELENNNPFVTVRVLIIHYPMHTRTDIFKPLRIKVKKTEPLMQSKVLNNCHM